MTQIYPFLLSDSVEADPELATRFVREVVLPAAVLIGAAYLAASGWLEKTWRQAEENHLRADRLAAYKMRQKWKTSDIQPLLSLEPSFIVQRRIAHLRGRGRPVVKQHRPLADELVSRFAMFRDDLTATSRRKAFDLWPWRKHHIESLYRGEFAVAKHAKIKGAHDYAERTVALALGMSSSSVHAICGDVRSMRRADPASADFPLMMLADFERWMKDGEIPNV